MNFKLTTLERFERAFQARKRLTRGAVYYCRKVNADWIEHWP